MRNYKEQTEAAYLTSQRQGNMVRDREREHSAHEDRRNRYTEWEQPGTQRYRGDTGNTLSSPAESRTSEGISNEGHRGKGPRNYKRSDERIREMVCDLLCDDPYLDASDIEVEVKSGDVILTGSVADRFAKRLAEDLAESVLGVVNIENRIHVNQDGKHLQEQERARPAIV
jgi:osmotically-inducible protein OsmY